jgi:hypothetical protein
MRWSSRWSLALLLALGAGTHSLTAQSRDIAFPAESPRGHTSTHVGFTEVSLDYGRPAVRGRKVWGALVPWDSVWRAGANENTVIAFTTPVTVGGTTLPAGRYGLHMIPTAAAWTIILSRQANAWGSFTYQQSEDAVRVSTTPRPAEMTERLVYTLDDVTDSTVTATLRWEKLAVPLPISVNTTQVVEDSITSQLRGLPQFFAQGWNQAARWALRHNRVEEAAAWADSAVARQANYQSLRTKALLQERRGDQAGADATLAQALAVATEADINDYGYELLGRKKTDEAITVFIKNTKDYPRSWNTYDSLGEAYAVKGDKKLAQANYRKALAMVGDEAQQRRIKAALAALN